MKFSFSHISTLCKYTGISFTAGAITHGAFSEERSLITAGIGILVYLLGGILEKVAHPDKKHSWANLLAIGVISSIGLGFFTGGLQHFPDSPQRSSWVVPIGFIMSLLAIYLLEFKQLELSSSAIKKIMTYGILSSLVVIALSVYAANYFKAHPVVDHHSSSSESPHSDPSKTQSKGHDHSTHRH